MGPGGLQGPVGFERELPQAQRDAEPVGEPFGCGPGFDVPHQRFDGQEGGGLVLLPGLDDDGTVAVLGTPQGRPERLFVSQRVPVHVSVAGADAAIEAIPCADVGELDDPPVVDRLTDGLGHHGIGLGA